MDSFDLVGSKTKLVRNNVQDQETLRQIFVVNRF